MLTRRGAERPGFHWADCLHEARRIYVGREALIFKTLNAPTQKKAADSSALQPSDVAAVGCDHAGLRATGES